MVEPTESLSTRVPSGNPLDLLTLRQFLAFSAYAHGRSMRDLAQTLGLHHDTVYEDLKTARTVLRTQGRDPEALDAAAGRCPRCGVRGAFIRREPREAQPSASDMGLEG